MPSVPALSAKWSTMLVVASGVFMATLDSSIVNISLPTLVDVFQAPFAAVQWVVLAYLLVITGLLLPAGRAAQALGRRRLFLIGFAVFTLGSLLAGFAPSVWFLVGFRAVQAVGGAAMQAIGPGLILDAFPARERGRALGIVLSAVSLGLVAGPVVGGALLGTLGWPFIFFINVPVGLLGILLGYRVLPHSPVSGRLGFDWYGAIALVVGLVLLLLGLNQIQRAGLGAPQVLASLAAGAAALSAFVWWQRRAPAPTLDLELFRIREFSAATLSSYLTFSGVAALVLLLPFYLQRVLDLPVHQVGLVLATVPAIMGVLGPVAGSLSDRYGTRPIASAGLVVFTAGLGSMATLQATSAPLEVVARLAFIGVGLGLFNSANGSSLMGAAPLRLRSQASAIMALARNMAQASGQALWGTLWAVLVMALVGVASAADAPAEQTVSAFRIVFGASAVVAGLGIFVSLVRGRSPHSLPDATAATEAPAHAPAHAPARAHESDQPAAGS